MKLRVKEQFICCIFVVILFLTGMCVEIPPADVSFSCIKGAPAVSTADVVITSASNVVRLEKACAIDMLRQDTSIYLSSNRSRNLVRRFLRVAMVFLSVETLLAHVFYSGELTDFACRQRVCSQVAIVQYIHQKDGKK